MGAYGSGDALNDFQQFLLLGLLAIFAAVFWMLVAALAWKRAEEVRAALLEADARISALEAAMAAGVTLEAPAARKLQSPAAVETIRAAQKETIPPRTIRAEPPLPLDQAPRREPMPAGAPGFAPHRANMPSVPTIEAPAPLPGPDLPQPPAKDGLSLGWILGGALIASAIVFLLRVAEGEGVFGPMSQALMMFVFGAGLVGFSEYLWRLPETDTAKQVQNRSSATLVAGAGLFALFAAPYVSTSVLGLLRPAPSLGLMGVAALIGFALALRHGWTLATLAIMGGYGAPALLQADAMPSGPVFAFLFTITAGALALAKHRGWWPLAFFAGGLSLLWGAWSVNFALTPASIPLTALYAFGLAGLGAVLAFDGSERAINLEQPWSPRPSWTALAWAGHGLILGSCVLLAHLFLASGARAMPAALAATALTASLAALAYFRQGFALTVLPAAAVSVLMLALWPLKMDPQQAQSFASICGLLGFASTVGGVAMMARNTASGPGAILAALTPALVLLCAHNQMGAGIDRPWLWAAAALFLGGLNAFAMDRIASEAGGPKNAPGASGAFAIGAVGCAVMAVSFGLKGFVMIAAVALVMAPLAWIDRRIDYPPLRWAAAALGAFVVAALALTRAPLDFAVSPTPFFNELTLGYGVAIGAFLAACRMFATGPAGYEGRVTVSLRLGVLALIVAFLLYQVRHLANAGQMTAPYASLWEFGGHVSVCVIAALVLTLRYPAPLRPLVFSFEAALFAAAVLHAAFSGLVWLNPWWGSQPAAVIGGPVFNSLAIGYALPALLFATYSWIQAGRGAKERSLLAAGLAIALGVCWALLEVRRAHHGSVLAGVSTSAGEHLTLTIALAASAAVVLAIGFWRKSIPLKAASATLTGFAIAKAMLVDVTAIDGIMKYGAIAGITAAAAAAFLAYQRFVFGIEAEKGAKVASQPGGDHNLSPPATP